MTVPLMPLKRPSPKAILAAKRGNKVVTKKKQFSATNTEDIAHKPAPLSPLWGLLSKMDPNGDLFVSDKGIIAVAGSVTSDSPSRTFDALKLSPIEREMVSKWAIVDGPEPDNEELATGLIFTMYQMLELAFSAGIQYEAARSTAVIASSEEEDVVDDASESEEENDAEMDSVMDDEAFGDHDDDDN